MVAFMDAAASVDKITSTAIVAHSSTNVNPRAVERGSRLPWQGARTYLCMSAFTIFLRQTRCAACVCNWLRVSLYGTCCRAACFSSLQSTARADAIYGTYSARHMPLTTTDG